MNRLMEILSAPAETLGVLIEIALAFMRAAIFPATISPAPCRGA